MADINLTEASNPFRFCLNLRFNYKIENPRKFDLIENEIIYGTHSCATGATALVIPSPLKGED